MVKPNIQRFTENGLVFEDGSEIEHVDHVCVFLRFCFVIRNFR